MAAPNGFIQMYGGLSMRFVRPNDEAFLLDMFMAARPWFNWTDLGRDQIRALYEDQLRLTRIGTGAMYPDHLDFVVEKTDQAVAHVVVDLGYHDWRVTQLEVHPLARGKGIGSDIIRSLQAAAQNGSMPLTVSTPMAQTNALAFYGRLGFGVVGEQAPMVHLAWLPPGRPLQSTRLS